MIMLAADAPTLAQTPINPILWSIIGVLVTMLLGLCIVVINIVKSQFRAIQQGMDEFQKELINIKNDIRDLQHGQELFSKDLLLKDMQIQLEREKNKKPTP